MSEDIERVALDRLQRITQLEDALRPFAEYARQMERQWTQRDDCVRYGVKAEGAKQVTYGDFRKAARLVK